MKRFIKSKKGIALLATLVVAAAAAFGAYAYFTNTGTVTGTPVTVGSVPLTGSFTVAYGTTAYAYPNCSTSGTPTALLPTTTASCNAVAATVPVTVTNGSEANELLSSYMITLSGSNSLSGHPDCTPADFYVNGAAYTGPVTVTSGGLPSLPTTLGPASDSPANQYSSSFKMELVDNSADQDACAGWSPMVTVSATS